MAISQKITFEVFKRDNFSCQYCGKKSPEVVLELDHIIPIKEGGGDNLENLMTSCFDCNRGKGKELLETFREGTDPNEQAILLLERERQLKEYNEVLKQVRKRKEKDINELIKYWESKIGTIPNYASPLGIMRNALNFLPKEGIMEAIDICASSHRKQEDKNWGCSYRSYFCGIIKTMTNNYGKGE